VFGVVAGVLALVESRLVEQGEGVMIAGVPSEEACAGRLGNEES
jgi:hypothetical protein